MKILGYEISRSQPIPITEERASIQDYLSYFGIPLSTNGSNVTYDTSLTISAVYRAVNVISDSIASLPLEPYKLIDDRFVVDVTSKHYNLLNVEPNPLYSKFNFWRALVSNVILQGNGYAYIERANNGDPIKLTLMDPDAITIYVSKDVVKYKVSGAEGFIAACDMIHILNYTKNGYSGISTIEYGSRVLGIAQAADKTAKGFFENGGNMSGIVQVEGRITPEKAALMKAAWNTAFSPYRDGTTPGGIAVMEAGTTYTPISMDPASAQLLESRKWNVTEVARLFGVSPAKLFSQENLAYNSLEHNNIDFLQTTLRPWLEKIENELARKLFRPSVRSTEVAKFNEDGILRADLETKAAYLSKVIDAGLMTLNEGRKQLGLPSMKNGDVIIVKSGNQPLDKLLNPNVQKDVRKKEK